MSEKLYSCLLRLFPSAFRGRYEEEALQLLRDRLSNERGFLLRLRLCFDLITDLIGALPGAYGNSYTEGAAAVSLTAHFDGVPSFRGLQKEPIPSGVVFIALLATLAALATLSFVSARPYHLVEQNAPQTPIESVLQRLNQSTSPDSLGGPYVRAHAIGGNIRPPILLSVVNPEAPKSEQIIKGPFPKIVIVRLIVDALGNAHDVGVVRSYRPEFDAEAVKAVEQEHFAPAEQNGKAVPFALNMVVNFWKDGQQPTGPPPPPPRQQ
jgi:TonB family protein